MNEINLEDQQQPQSQPEKEGQNVTLSQKLRSSKQIINNQAISQNELKNDMNNITEETTSTGIFLAKRKKLFEAQEALEKQREIYKQ